MAVAIDRCIKQCSQFDAASACDSLAVIAVFPGRQVPLQGCYSLSEMAHQPLDQFKKIFTIKLQYTFYKETVGVRKGQIAKIISGQVRRLRNV